MPFRDRRTLTLFLRAIDGFTYENSETLGNAFEYLLSILGSQGDAGQFRTPRHIIDFIVEVVDPQPTERILDPACGTAGFLVGAYKRIIQKREVLLKQGKKKNRLTEGEKEKISKNLVGYDISPDMVKLSLANLFLHGFKAPQVYEYDTLTSDKKWHKKFEVVLANPPFMTPKGGIVPHNRFSIQSKRSEILFVDYIAEHLTPEGRAGIVVPEGIIFQTGKASIALRKNLIEKRGLYAVVSLPVGVFQPYSGVKTSILFLDKKLAKQKEEILFLKVIQDGFHLGSHRKKIAHSDLPACLRLIKGWQKSKFSLQPTNPLALVVSKERIAQDSYYLIADRYRNREEDYSKAKWPMLALGTICTIKTGKKNVGEGNPEGAYPFFTCAKENTFSHSYSFDTEALLIAGNGDVGNLKYYKGKFEAYQRTYVLSNFKGSLPKYLYFLLYSRLKKIVAKSKLGNTISYIKIDTLKQLHIPIPPLSFQQAIITEIEKEQKSIEGHKNCIVEREKSIAEKITKIWKQKA